MTDMNNRSHSHDDAYHISANDFLKIGMNQIGYIKPVIFENQELYGVFAANGEQILVSDNYASALGAMHQHELHAVALN